jgi:RNA polymerase sigma-70 factor (ECF subfamily)
VLPVAKVDEVYQAAVALYYLDGCSYRQIAAILGVPIGTIKSRIARGISRLREILDGNASEPDYPEWDLSATLAGERLGAF